MNCIIRLYLTLHNPSVLCLSLLQAIQHGLLNFERFNVNEYEHYEVNSRQIHINLHTQIITKIDWIRECNEHDFCHILTVK